jgi:hypothetical protein
MEYKGVEYQVVQTTDPTGWKWTVELGREQTRTGSGRSRTAAIGLAQITIDEAIKKGSPINSTGLTVADRTGAHEGRPLSFANKCAHESDDCPHCKRQFEIAAVSYDFFLNVVLSFVPTVGWLRQKPLPTPDETYAFEFQLLNDY